MPPYSFGHRQPDPPHRKRVLARFTDGQGIEYEICTNWPRTAWWLNASKADWRMSNTLRTTSKQQAERWRTAVESGNVGLKETR